MIVNQQSHICNTRTDKVLSSETGFIYKSDSKYYLITNWHNVSGRNPFTGEYISNNQAIPDIFSTMFRDKEQPANCLRKQILLYNDEDMLSPIWLVHPDNKEKVDVVAIPLGSEIVDEFRLFPITDIQFDNDFRSEVSDDVFVIGYPFSNVTYLQMPIWKKGSIVSEPDINLDNTPKIFIDTATRPGISGSPVIFQRIGIHGYDGKAVSDNVSIGRIRGFLGIYSGRVGKDEFKAQLGIVWKGDVINEIIEGAVLGDSID